MYENRAGRFRISPGSLLFTRPGDWHRFRPKKRTGWVEHYLGFSGEIAHRLFRQPWIMQKNAVVQVGYREEILDTYYKIFEFVIEEKPGYQQVSAGMVMKLLSMEATCRADARPSRGLIGIKKGPTASSANTSMTIAPRILSRVLTVRFFTVILYQKASKAVM